MKGNGFGFGFGAASFFTAESRSSRREGSVQARTAQGVSVWLRNAVSRCSARLRVKFAGITSAHARNPAAQVGGKRIRAGCR